MFKIGDKVKIIDIDNSYFKDHKDEIGEIEEGEDEDDEYCIEFDNEHAYAKEHQIELVDEESGDKFKVGDKIRGISCDIEGAEGIIVKDTGTGYHIKITYNPKECHLSTEVGEILTRDLYWEDCLELIDEEDKASFNVGDRIRRTDDADRIGEIIEGKDNDGDYIINWDSGGNGYVYEGNIELIPNEEEDHKWEEGDKVKVKEDCSDCVVGNIYRLALDKDELYATDDELEEGKNGCTCEDNWILVSKAKECEEEDESEGIFKIGDEVKYIGDDDKGDASDYPLWGGKYGYIIGKIVSSGHSVGTYNVNWSNGESNDGMPEDELRKVEEYELKFVRNNNKRDEGEDETQSPQSESKPNKMIELKKIPRTLKRLLNKELRMQYKAGLIDGDLELTHNGREEMFDILSQEKIVQEGLTKFAEEIIKEVAVEEKKRK